MNITVTSATETVYLVTIGLQTHRLTPDAARKLRDTLNALQLGLPQSASSGLDELKKQYEKQAFPEWPPNPPIICNTPVKGGLLSDPGFVSGMPGQPGGPGKEFN